LKTEAASAQRQGSSVATFADAKRGISVATNSDQAGLDMELISVCFQTVA
jgi:hypothetical protein